jgi:hypothetical protein
MHLRGAARGMQRDQSSGRVPKQCYRRTNGRYDPEHIFVFPFNFVIGRIWVAASMPAPVQSNYGEVPSQQREGPTPECAIHKTCVY